MSTVMLVDCPRIFNFVAEKHGEEHAPSKCGCAVFLHGWISFDVAAAFRASAQAEKRRDAQFKRSRLLRQPCRPWLVPPGMLSLPVFEMDFDVQAKQKRVLLVS